MAINVYSQICLDNWYGGEPGWVEFPEEDVDELHGAVPPEASRGNSFLVGEPYTTNSLGELVFLCLIFERGKYYGQLMTRKTYDEASEKSGRLRRAQKARGQ